MKLSFAAHDPRYRQTHVPRVSVLMATYNSAAYIGEAFVCVLNQTMDDFELIVVDDGSTDHSPGIIARYVEQDARVIVHRQENQGIGGATNQALGLARASYIAILDSDDTKEPARLAIQADYLDAHPDITAVGSQWLAMNDRGDIVGIDRQPTDPDQLFTMMFAFFALHHPTIMARKAPMLSCGGYDTRIKRGAMDYRLFFDLLLAGHKMTNLPSLLTRWRYTPSGATHSNAREQTQAGEDIRARAYKQIAAEDPQRADRIACDLVRTFPIGSWCDVKAARGLAVPGISPALRRRRELAAQQRNSEQESVCVDWLHDEETHAERLASLLNRDGLSWLAQLVLARSGRATAPATSHTTCSMPEGNRLLTLLMPSHVGDEQLTERIRSGLEALPLNSEVLVFSVDGAPITLPTSIEHSALRVLSGGEPAGSAWRQALCSARGEFIACLAARHRHHPGFIAQALAALQASKACSLVYGPADFYYPDALDGDGQPGKDPAPPPRWTRAALLRKNRASMSCMVFRRELLDELAIDVEETGPLADWAIARQLVTDKEALILPLRNVELAPKIAIGNHIMEVVTQRIVSWYLDTGRGGLPIPAAWSRLSAAQGVERLHYLDARLRNNELYVHEGNAELLAEFAARFGKRPLFHSVVNHLLLHHPGVALPRFGKRSAWAAAMYGPWRFCLRGYFKYRRLVAKDDGRVAA